MNMIFYFGKVMMELHNRKIVKEQQFQYRNFEINRRNRNRKNKYRFCLIYDMEVSPCPHQFSKYQANCKCNYEFPNIIFFPVFHLISVGLVFPRIQGIYQK